jgi:hypothetical protein
VLDYLGEDTGYDSKSVDDYDAELLYDLKTLTNSRTCGLFDSGSTEAQKAVAREIQLERLRVSKHARPAY